MRRYYKLLSWDYVTNRGLATDGTSWDGQPITFDVYADDLAPEYNGFLNINEVFTAIESPSRILYEIVIEEGPRAARPAQATKFTPLTDDAVEGIVNASLSVNAQVKHSCGCGPNEQCYHCAPKPTVIAESFAAPTDLNAVWTAIKILESKVKRLERIIVDKQDDHK